MGDAALRNLERAWRGGDPAARQQLAEGYLRRGLAQAAAEVFAEAPPASDGEAEVYGRAWGRILAGFAPRERVTGLQAYGELVGWCGPRGRYGALYNRARGELRVLDRERVCLLAGGLPLRGVTQVAVAARPRDPGLAELYVDYALGVRARGRWRLEPDELPEAVSHVPFAARWTRLATPADELPPGLFGEASLYVEAVEWPIPSDAAWRGASCAAWLHAGTLTVVDGEARSYDLAASWARRDPVAAASDSLGSSRCAFLPDGALLAGLARVDLAAGEVSFARERLDVDALGPRAEGGALLGLVAGRLRRVRLGAPTPLVPRALPWAPGGAPGGEPAPAERHRGWWHPLAEVAAVAGPDGAWVGIPDARPSVRLPLGTAPLGWTPDGERLLVARGAGDAVALELWGAS